MTQRTADRIAALADSLDPLDSPDSKGDSFAALGSHFLTRQPARPIPEPYLVAASPEALAQLGFDSSAPADPDFLACFSGDHPQGDMQDVSHGRLPYATVYSGHQFGHWAGQLGDGRALTLGELSDVSGERQDIQLKGSGLTPYSRMGDGRAVLRSSLREFLCSEAMFALGIPTTRALSVIGSDLPVRRETIETAAVVARFAPSLVRFGHFEHFASAEKISDLRLLADHVIDRFYPENRRLENPYLGLLEAVTLRTADLMVKWQAVGFCHGVMNTDNMSILGLTIDYGPFGFMDGFDARHICNHTDSQGRYAYQSQPQVAYWNLFCLAQSLLPLIADPGRVERQAASSLSEDANTDRDAVESRAIEAAKAVLERYKARYADGYLSTMRQKLGLGMGSGMGSRIAGTAEAAEKAGDAALIDRLLQLMNANRADFTLTFRRLAAISARGAEHDVKGVPESRDLFLDRPAFDVWLQDYRQRLAAENLDHAGDARRRAAMNRVNPKYVLRNHLAEVAIRAARDKQFDETRRLLDVLRHPFEEQPENEAYAALPPDWATALEVSCSS